jgi:hypothetical protein
MEDPLKSIGALLFHHPWLSASMRLPPFFRAYIFATLDPHAPEFKANYDESYENSTASSVPSWTM